MIFQWLQRKFEYRKGNVLALGGGGARGLAHIGVIKALERNGWKPDLITGTSMGAIVGALYALYKSASVVEKKLLRYGKSDTFKDFDLADVSRKTGGGSRKNEHWRSHVARLLLLARLGNQQSILSSKVYRKIFDEVFEDRTFDDLKIPFVAIATDLLSGEDIELTEGRLADACAASAAIPGVFSPVKINEMILVDGGVSKNIPVPEKDDKNYYVLAVDVPCKLEADGPFNHAIDVMNRSDQITQYHLHEFYLAQADAVITPEVRHIHWADFERMKELIEIGERAGEEWASRNN